MFNVKEKKSTFTQKLHLLFDNVLHDLITNQHVDILNSKVFLYSIRCEALADGACMISVSAYHDRGKGFDTENPSDALMTSLLYKNKQLTIRNLNEYWSDLSGKQDTHQKNKKCSIM